jgi:GNAT superfamily N-acetyltransferase
MEYIRVTMIRDDLEEIPRYALPGGWRMRDYEPGDEWDAWMRIEAAADRYTDVTPERVRREWGGDPDSLARRMMFLVSPEGRDVGTITAWYTRRYAGRRWGRIHWVAIEPEYQGRGFGKAMMTAGMNRLRKLGHRRAMLATQTPRLAAIKVYLDFGFRPDLTQGDARRAWRLVRDALGHDALKHMDM